MKNHDRTLLRLMMIASIAIVVVAMLGAWWRFDYRAAGIAFCAAGAGMAAMYCQTLLIELREDVHDETLLNELLEDERTEPTRLKCRDCGEVYEYYTIKEPPEGRENERPLRCPICGGELDAVEASEDEPGA